MLEDLIDRGYNILDTHFEEVAKKELTDHQIARYKNFKNRFERDDPALKKRLMRDMEIAIMNGSLANKTRKKRIKSKLSSNPSKLPLDQFCSHQPP